MALLELTVENLAVVESVRVELGGGFTAVTGETGAGKSLVVDAVALALGARAASEQVRSGAQRLRVEAVFDAPSVEDDDPLAEVVAAGEGVLIVRREVGSDGRSLVRVNDRTVTVGALATLGGRLAEIHGQNEQQRLLEPERQLALLDRHAGLEPLAEEVAAAWRAWKAVEAEADQLVVDPHQLARRLELLRHEAEEIEAAGLRPGEEGEVEERLRAAAHAESVARAAADAVRRLRDDAGGLDALREVAESLHLAAADDPRFSEPAERAAGLVAEGEELARDVAAALEQVDLDPAQRVVLEERLGLIRDLERKYGETLQAVLDYRDAAIAELARLDDQEGLRERLTRERGERRATLEAGADRLSGLRQGAAVDLAERVNRELPPLGLPAGAFGVALEPVEPGPRGADRVTFTFAPNPGEAPRSLARIASGGEASRLSLALKLVLAAADEVPLLVFDEIDAGVGGRNAGGIGERLRALGRYHQVLCVTHLPQVAAHADRHLHVGKRVEEGRTFTQLSVLEGEARTRELAAMLGGAAAGDEAQAAAEALLRGVRA